MRVLFFQFPLVPAWGGAENQTLALAKGLKDNGKEILLSSSNSFLIRAFRKNGFPAENSWAGFEPTSVRALFLFPFTFFVSLGRLGVSFLTFRPNVIFCLSLTDKLIATILATLFNSRVIWVEHTRIGRWLTGNPLRFWYKAMSRTVRIVSPSYFLRNQLIAFGVSPDKITVIYPGTSLPEDRLKPENETIKLKKRGESSQLGFIGRLAQEKGVKVLLYSLKAINGASLSIAGTGPAEASLKKLARELNISDRTKFIGFASDQNSFFRSIDMLVVPSVKAESFGLVIIEAMSAGIPIVASRIGAIPEIIEHKKTGLLFEPGNTRELAECIKLLQYNPELRQSICENAKQSVLSRFSVKKMVSEYAKLIS